MKKRIIPILLFGAMFFSVNGFAEKGTLMSTDGDNPKFCCCTGNSTCGAKKCPDTVVCDDENDEDPGF